MDIDKIAAALQFPASELVIEDVVDEEAKINSSAMPGEHLTGPKPPFDVSGLLSAYRITSRTPSAFYPLLISIARQGTFFSPEAQDFFEQANSLPDGLLEQGGRGHYGDLPIGDGMTGGIYMKEIRVPSAHWPDVKMATISEVRIPAKQVDIRIAMLHSFDPADLVKVPRGEQYYELLHTPGGDKNYDEPPPKEEFDYKTVLSTLNQLVIESPLVADLPLAAGSGAVVKRLDAVPPLPSSGAGPLAVSNGKSGVPLRSTSLWPWLFGIAVAASLGWMLVRRHSH